MVSKRVAEAINGVDHPLITTLRKIIFQEIMHQMLWTDLLTRSFNDPSNNSGVTELVISGSTGMPGLIRSPGDIDICMYGSDKYNALLAEKEMAKMCRNISEMTHGAFLEVGVRETGPHRKTKKQKQSGERKSGTWQRLIQKERVQRFYLFTKVTPQIISDFIQKAEEGRYELNARDIATLRSAVVDGKFTQDIIEAISQAQKTRCSNNGSITEYNEYNKEFCSADEIIFTNMIDSASQAPPQTFRVINIKGEAVDGDKTNKAEVRFRAPIHELVLAFLSSYSKEGTRDPKIYAKRAFDLYLRTPKERDSEDLEIDKLIAEKRQDIRGFVDMDIPQFSAIAKLLLVTQPSFQAGEYHEAADGVLEAGLRQLVDSNVIFLGNDTVEKVAKVLRDTRKRVFDAAFAGDDKEHYKKYITYCKNTRPEDLDIGVLNELITNFLRESDIEEPEQKAKGVAVSIKDALIEAKEIASIARAN